MVLKELMWTKGDGVSTSGVDRVGKQDKHPDQKRFLYSVSQLNNLLISFLPGSTDMY